MQKLLLHASRLLDRLFLNDYLLLELIDRLKDNDLLTDRVDSLITTLIDLKLKLAPAGRTLTALKLEIQIQQLTITLSQLMNIRTEIKKLIRRREKFLIICTIVFFISVLMFITNLFIVCLK